MLDVQALRQQFPGLHRKQNGRLPIFLDAPAGTQVPQRVIDAIVSYLTHCNTNHGGVFATSRQSDEIIDSAHAALADLIHAPSADEILFGQNMTSLTFHLSRSIAKTLKLGDQVLVSRLDHDANVAPWLLAAHESGAEVRWIDIHQEDCTLDLDDFRKNLSARTRFVAVGLASNAVGTINDAATICREAKKAGALAFVDAVHFAPHGAIDVQALGCDFLACSAYKFFGPHVGVLWGRRELLEELPACKVRPATNVLPGRWMTGTQNHEGLAGVAAAVEYLTEFGRHCPTSGVAFPDLTGRRLELRVAMTSIQEHERTLSREFLKGMAERPQYKVWGIADPTRVALRVPTFALTRGDQSPHHLAERLAERQIYSWSGNLYAIEVTERLGLEQRGGFLRLGFVHYNTIHEVQRTLSALDEI
ncbi:MAG: cysteine desulfurase-like protein [Planctomycetes bacterium]|nr:cysteine desulfurase-like protein [Planctomycetota bacterium]